MANSSTNALLERLVTDRCLALSLIVAGIHDVCNNRYQRPRGTCACTVEEHYSSDCAGACSGFVHGQSSKSDKKVGVVALVFFDLRRRGKVGNLSMVGTTGSKFPAIREHLHQKISQVYNNLDVSFQSFPADDVQYDPNAYIAVHHATIPRFTSMLLLLVLMCFSVDLGIGQLAKGRHCDDLYARRHSL
jgi:hypothetical protein